MSLSFAAAKNEYADYLGIQRKLNVGRIAEIKEYVGTIDACFPTSIVISVTAAIGAMRSFASN
jgi:hypothetical protein